MRRKVLWLQPHAQAARTRLCIQLLLSVSHVRS